MAKNQHRQRRDAILIPHNVNINVIHTTTDDSKVDEDLTRIPSLPKFYLGGECHDDTTKHPNNIVQILDSPQYSSVNERHLYSILNKSSVQEGAAPILRAIKKFDCITSMQSLLNCIFGPILALDIGLLVLVSCLLLYLKINYLGSGSVHYVEGITFVGNCIVYFVRLCVVFISLGNVHEMSIHFNDCVTTSLLHVKSPQAPEINLVVAHLTRQFANPSCFNAAGFFIFSRGSLLAVLSAIMTYVIFLLQAKK